MPRRRVKGEMPLPADAVPLYVTPEQVSAMTGFTWPKAQAGTGYCGIDLRTRLGFITPAHPEFKDMVEAWGGEEEKAKWEAWKEEHDKEISELRSELEANGVLEPKAEDYGYCAESGKKGKGKAQIKV